MTYPATLDTFPRPVDGVTDVLAVDFGTYLTAIEEIEEYLGLTGDAAAGSAGSGTIHARVKRLESLGGGIVKQAAQPSSPAAEDLWIETDDSTRPLRIFVSSAYQLVGANAITLRGLAIDTAAPSDNMIPVWDAALAKIVWEAPAVAGMANPMTEQYGILIGGTVTGGVAAPAQLAPGDFGQVPTIQLDGSLAYATPPYLGNPASSVVGSVMVKDATNTWSHVPPITSGYVLTSNGVGAVPTWQVIPISSPGTGITTPGGVRIGDILQYDELGAWALIHPGTEGQVLTAHGNNNVVGSKLTWAAPAAGMTNPLTTAADLIVGGVAGAPARLGIGSNGQVLTIAAGAPAWAAPSSVNTDYATAHWIGGD